MNTYIGLYSRVKLRGFVCMFYEYRFEKHYRGLTFDRSTGIFHLTYLFTIG